MSSNDIILLPKCWSFYYTIESSLLYPFDKNHIRTPHCLEVPALLSNRKFTTVSPDYRYTFKELQLSCPRKDCLSKKFDFCLCVSFLLKLAIRKYESTVPSYHAGKSFEFSVICQLQSLVCNYLLLIK